MRALRTNMAASLDFGQAVRITDDSARLPLTIEATRREASLTGLLGEFRGNVTRALDERGAILFRGFDVKSAEGFEAGCATLGELMPYRDRATPRTQVRGNVLTATEYPPNVAIFLHNENVFAAEFPALLFFFCVRPAEGGGETPIADVRRVLSRLPDGVRTEFERRDVRYTRSFGRGFGLDWRDVFQTADRAGMERYCRDARVHFEWEDGEKLRTWQIRPAVAVHPRTRERVWLNHAAALHVSTLEPAKRRMLVKMFGEGDLPNNVTYGDGGPIEDEVIAAVREAYEMEAQALQWQANDILLLDNMLVAHGRWPFRGRRELLVAMTGPIRWADVAHGNSWARKA